MTMKSTQPTIIVTKSMLQSRLVGAATSLSDVIAPRILDARTKKVVTNRQEHAHAMNKGAASG